LRHILLNPGHDRLTRLLQEARHHWHVWRPLTVDNVDAQLLRRWEALQLIGLGSVFPFHFDRSCQGTPKCLDHCAITWTLDEQWDAGKEGAYHRTVEPALVLLAHRS